MKISSGNFPSAGLEPRSFPGFDTRVTGLEPSSSVSGLSAFSSTCGLNPLNQIKTTKQLHGWEPARFNFKTEACASLSEGLSPPETTFQTATTLPNDAPFWPGCLVAATTPPTTNRSREYDGNQRRSVYFHRTASSGWDRTCWSICFNLWSRCACLSDTTDSKVKYNKIKGKQMQVHANPKCCTAEFRRGSGRSPVLSLDAINADRQVLRACSENW